jgi:hypothetical protein
MGSPSSLVGYQWGLLAWLSGPKLLFYFYLTVVDT